MTILPLTYLGSVEYFARLLQGDCTVDLGEHFVKRSERNRTRILACDGPMELTVHVCRANRPRTPMRDLRIDYSKRWQHQHWGALVSAYRSSPYFEHYAPKLEPFYRREWHFLVDYNLELLALLTGWMGIGMPSLSERYVEAGPEALDLRGRRAFGTDFTPEPYIQVFADRMPFVPNLSVADLLFAEGPGSAALLRRCRCGSTCCR